MLLRRIWRPSSLQCHNLYNIFLVYQIWSLQSPEWISMMYSTYRVNYLCQLLYISPRYLRKKSFFLRCPVAMLQTFPSWYLSLTNLLLNLQTYFKIFYSLSHITSSLTKFIFSPRLRYTNIYLSLHLIFFYFVPFCVYFTM